MSCIAWEELLKSNVEVMSSAFKTDGNDLKILGAFLCSAYEQVADSNRINECKSILKDRFGALSEFRGNLQVPLIVKMSLSDNPSEYLNRVSGIYEELSAGYKMGNDMRLLAAIILCDNTTYDNQSRVCELTGKIYESMKEDHKILSGQNDLPFAALMSIQNDDDGHMLECAEECYGLLTQTFKHSKKDMLNVSRILSFGDISANESVESFVKMYDALKTNKLEIKGMQMTILSVLVNLGLDVDEAVSQIASNDKMLMDIKGFHGAFGLSSVNRRMYAAAITALNNSTQDTIVEGTVASSVMSVILSVEMVAIMFLYIPVVS